ncbi:hypothetical protein, partial [Bradyrhizobium sp. SZCCHNR1022]|uniref:hypothetical protein n=1 Tax=Bradyrhizobium sp. SZCCHNR1022 TaxID=3057345 RepID=UPI00291613D7
MAPLAAEIIERIRHARASDPTNEKSTALSPTQPRRQYDRSSELNDVPAIQLSVLILFFLAITAFSPELKTFHHRIGHATASRTTTFPGSWADCDLHIRMPLGPAWMDAKADGLLCRSEMT